MKTRNLGKRIISIVLTFAFVISLFSALDFSAFAASYIPKAKIFLANQDDPNANNAHDEDMLYPVIQNEHHDSIYDGTYYHHTGDVTIEENYYNKDSSEKYVFRNWSDRVDVVSYKSSITTTDKFNRTFYYNFQSTNQFSGIVYFSGAVYDTYYRMQVANDAAIDQYVKFNQDFTLPEYDGDVPAGKMFVGWKDTNEGIIFAANTTFQPDAARNFVPYFVTENKGLTYFKDADTGVLYHAEEVDPQDDTVVAPDAPSKKGYTFEYWTDGTDDYVSGETIQNATGKTFVAVWKAKKYEIKTDVSNKADLDFHFPELDNTYAPVDCEVKFTVDVDEGFKLTKVTVEGLETEGYIAYKYDEGTGYYSFDMPTEDVKITVATTANKFVAYFKDSLTNQIYDIKYVDPDTQTLTTANEPEKEGYTFKYWYRLPGNEYPANTNITALPDSDYVFYAKWEVNEYDVFKSEGGDSVVTVSETSPEYGELVEFKVDDTNPDEVITSVTVEGKNSNGFYAYDYDEFTGIYSFYMPAEDVTINVKTDVPAYIVYFKDVDGQIYDVVNFDADTDVLHTPVAPEKVGYEFLNWDNGVQDYDADSDVLVPLKANNVYYAEWTPKIYNVDDTTLVEGSAVVNVSSTTAAYNTIVTFKVGDTNPNENIVGIEVKGTVSSRYVVFTYDDFNDEYYFTMPAEDVKIEVVTSIDEYAVTFLDWNNDYIATRHVLKGESIGDVEMPYTPFRFGYYFDKWQVQNETGGYEFTSSTAVFSNLVVKACFVGIDYNIYKANDCDAELEYLYARSQDNTGYTYNTKDLMDPVVTNSFAKVGDKVYFDVAPTPTYSITGIAVREPGTDNYVAAPTLVKKYKDHDDNDCYTFAFTMPANEIEIAVYVAPNVYTVYADENVDADGEFRINGVITDNLGVAQGNNVELRIEPKAGYYVKNVTAVYTDEHGNPALPIAVLNQASEYVWTYNFTMVSADVHVEIEYAPYDYSINVTDSNADSYKPVWDGDKYIVIESLDAEKTSKGFVTLLDDSNSRIRDWVAREATKNCYQPIDVNDAHVGDEVKFSIGEYTGYDLDCVVVTYANGTKTCPITLKNGIYYFTMPADDVVVRAYFKEETYKVTKGVEDEQKNDGTTVKEYGEVTINGLREAEVKADYKDTVTVEVQPKPGYYVDTISYTLVDGTNKDGKAVVEDFSNAAKYTGTQLLDTADTKQSVTFNMPAKDVDITVTYKQINFSVETEVTSGDETGTITVTTPNKYNDEVTFTLTPKYGYILNKFNILNVNTGKKIPCIAEKIDATYGSSFTFEMPASKVKITAEYVKDAYQVTYLDVNGAYIGQEAIKFEETATLYPNVVSVPNGQHFIGWVSADTKTPVTTASTSTADFVINKNTVIRADYALDNTVVKFNESQNGYTELADQSKKTKTGNFTIDTKYGDTVTFNVVPDEGYELDTITVVGKNVTGDKNLYIEEKATATANQYKFTIPALYKTTPNADTTAQVEVKVTFKKITYSLTKKSVTTGGTVAVNGQVATETAYTYEYLDNVKITATPDKGYYVKSIKAVMVNTATSTEDATHKYVYNGSKPAKDVYGTEQSVSYNMPATDMTFEVEFAKCDFSITYTVESGATTGTLTGATVKQIDDQVEFTVTPKYGYIVDTLTVTDNIGNVVFDTKDIDRTNGGTYKFVMPASPVKVNVNYVKDAYEVVYKDSNDTVLLTESIKFEETATLGTEPTSAPAGYHFVGWVSSDTKTPVTTASLDNTKFVINKKTVIVASYSIDQTDVTVQKTVDGYVYGGNIDALNTASTKASDVKGRYNYGDTVTLNLVPDKGFTLAYAYVDCKSNSGVETNFVPVNYNELTNEISFVIPEIHKATVKSAVTDELIVRVAFRRIYNVVPITYCSHVSNIGWTGDVSFGKTSGIIDGKSTIEALNINVPDGYNIGLQYSAHVQNIGWMDPATNGNYVGTVGRALSMEAITINLTGADADIYDVYYRVYIDGYGMLGWAKNGERAGSQGLNLQMRGIEITVVAKDTFNPKSEGLAFVEEVFSYSTHTSNIGWEDNRTTEQFNSISENFHEQLEAVSIKMVTSNDVNVIYAAHVANIGWMNDAKNGEIAGTTGRGLPIEAFYAYLTGSDADKYDIFYRAFVDGFGALGWARNGELAGTTGLSLPIRGLEVKVVPKGSFTPDNTVAYKDKAVSYSVHMSYDGWLDRVWEGNYSSEMQNTHNLEAVCVRYMTRENVGVKYATHVSDIGWVNESKDGEISGTIGKGLAAEAFYANLYGADSNKYDIYYRVTTQNRGTLGWAKNGELAGSVGFGDALRGIEILIVERGTFTPVAANAFFAN